MGIPFNCACGFEGEEDDARMGKLAPCPRCGELQRVGGAQRKGVRRERPEPTHLRPRTTESWDDQEEAGNPYAPPRRVADTGPVSYGNAPVYDEAPQDYGYQGPPRDLGQEAHVVALAIWQILGGAIFCALALIVYAAAELSPPDKAAASLVMLVVGVFFAFVGFQLKAFQNWARWVYGALTVVSIVYYGVSAIVDPSNGLAAVVSVAWSGACLSVLFSDRGADLFRPSYQETLKSSNASPPWGSSPFFWVPWVVCGIMCLLVNLIGIGVAGAVVLSGGR